MRLKDKVAIVTGAAQNIGQVYAETLAREGAKVAVVDLKREQSERVAEGINDRGGQAIAVQADISDLTAVEAMAQQVATRFSGIDILVNNASIFEGYIRYSLIEVPLDYWNKFLAVNLTGTLICTKAVLPHMIKRGKGRIVNQSSTAADVCRNQYGVTKLGVQGLTVGLARELGKYNITVNCIAPGATNTKSTLDLYPDIMDQVNSQQVIKRIGTPHDLAHGLLYLVADEADWITGQVLHIDGGRLMRPG